MQRCKTCVMPLTRPDTPVVDGECAACVSFKRRPTIDWDERRAQLLALLDRHGGRVLVPSSGGKDSTYQVMTLLELGADVTVVTARTCQLTALGRENIDNLARHARTIEVVPNMATRAKLNRLGLELVGDISWPEHAAIFSTPLRVALETGHTLLMYGENPQDQYGGPMGTEQAQQMTRRWITEFGGFLGLRPDDLATMTSDRAMDDYRLPPAKHVADAGIEAHFLGQYIPWDSRRNAHVALAAGMRAYPGGPPGPANWWLWENLDNAQTGLHDHFMWLKYGFGRGCQQISVDVRAGYVQREHALVWLADHDGTFPYVYAGVTFEQVLDRIDVTHRQLKDLMARYTNTAIHHAG